MKIDVQDERAAGKRIDVRSKVICGLSKKDAVARVLAYENGILCAPTAFRKTVVAASLISAGAVNTLIPVHRRQLMDQWRERLTAYLALPIGISGNSVEEKTKEPGLIDVAVIQSLQHKGAIEDFVADYGHVIVVTTFQRSLSSESFVK